MLKTTENSSRIANSRQVALGAVASGLVNIIKVGLQLVMLPVLARLMGPSEFGVYALAAPTVLFISLLADGGLGATLAREPESNSLVWSSAFWFLLLTGVILALGATGFGFLLGYVASQPRVAQMIATLSLSIVFLVLSVLPSARLARRKNLGIGAAAELVANVSGAASAIILASQGAGAWSLVLQYLTIYAVRAVGLNLVAFDLPTFEFSLNVVKSHLAVGGLIIISRLVDYSSRIGETFLVDQIFGTPTLGKYTFSNQISKFTGEAIGNVTWAALYVQTLTSDQQSAAAIYRKLTRLISVILFPITFLGAAAAPELISLLLGPSWSELTPLLRVFLPLAAFLTLAHQVTAILLAINRFEIAFWCTCGLSLGRLFVVCSGMWIGFTAAVYGIALISAVYIAALLVYAAQPTGCSLAALVRDLSGPAISSLVGAVVCTLVLHLHSASTALTFISLAIGAGAFAICMITIDLKSLVEDWRTLRRVLQPAVRGSN